MSFQQGKAVKGMLNSVVSEAEEKAAADEAIRKAQELQASATSRALAENAKNNLAAGAVRFATSFPGLSMFMPDGRQIRFITGVVDLTAEKDIEEMRSTIRAGNRQIWEVK